MLWTDPYFTNKLTNWEVYLGKKVTWKHNYAVSNPDGYDYSGSWSYDSSFITPTWSASPPLNSFNLVGKHDICYEFKIWTKKWCCGKAKYCHVLTVLNNPPAFTPALSATTFDIMVTSTA